VYFTYGMHWCANVVAGRAAGRARGAAARRRAGRGIETMRAAPRERAGPRPRARAGPLCQALGITGAHDGADLTRGRVRVVDDGTAPPPAPARRRRASAARARATSHSGACVPATSIARPRALAG
jgi:DNA-3-methyladenine glycosylase